MNEITDNWQEILSFMEVEMGLYHASIDTWIKPLKVYNIEGNCISYIYLMSGSKVPNYDAYGLLRTTCSHTPTQYSHIVGLK